VSALEALLFPAKPSPGLAAAPSFSSESTTKDGSVGAPRCSKLRFGRRSEIVPDQLCRQDQDDGDEDGADEFGSARNDHTGAHSCAQKLAHAHRKTCREKGVAPYNKKDERAYVAREVHYLGVSRGPGQVEAEAQHESHRPKCARAGTEKAIVETKGQTEHHIKPAARHPGMQVFDAQSWPQKGVGGYGDEQEGDGVLEERAPELLHRQGAQSGPGQREDEATRAVPERNGFGLCVMPGSAARAERRLEFVRSQSLLRVQAQAQQHRQRDQPAPARNRIDKPRRQSSPEQEWKVPGFEHAAMVEGGDAGLKEKAGRVHHFLLRQGYGGQAVRAFGERSPGALPEQFTGHLVAFNVSPRAGGFVLCASAGHRYVNATLELGLMKRASIYAAGVVLFVCCGQRAARAWDYEGHRIVNGLALASLPAGFPDFVKEPGAAERVAFLSGEPDRWRNTQDLPLKHSNGPEHYIDLEELAAYGLNAEMLPVFRYDFEEQLAVFRKEHPEKFREPDPAANADHTRQMVGLLPWAIAENSAKLKSCFSYLKAFQQGPGTEAEIANAQADVIYVMGVLGHYVGDASQPLHTTLHFNGWAGNNPNAYTTNRTFHGWIDGGFFRKIGGANFKAMRANLRPAQPLSLNGRPARPEEMFQAAIAFIVEQNKLVEPLYQLEKDGKLSGEGDTGRQGQAFLEAQLLKSAQFLGDIWYSAWQEAPPDTYLAGQLARRHSAGDAGAEKK